MFFRAIALGLMVVSQVHQVHAETGTTPKLRPEMLVTTAWLADHLKDTDLVVLCIDSAPEFYSRGHIPGARQIKLSEIAVTRDGIPNELPSMEAMRQAFSGQE